MARRTHGQVAAAAVTRERVSIVAFAAEHCRQIDGLEAKQRLTAAEASMLKRRLTAFAEQIEQGMHV